MTVFIEARTEPFQRSREEYAERGRQSETTQAVRRPHRGYQLKEDTYAVIRVMGPNGDFMEVIDAAGAWAPTSPGTENYTTHYTNFFVQQISEERHEKQQVVDTFGDSFIFFFGEAPRMLRVSGLLLNTADFNWRNEWWANYERYFRGTKLVELGARLYLIYDDRIIEGYMTGAQANDNSQQKEVIQFSFSMFVTGSTDISALGDPRFPSPTDLDYTQLSSYEEALKLWESNRNLQRENTTRAVAAANRLAYLGSGGLMSSVIRSGIINGGDPSVAGFVARASAALQTASAVVDGVRQVSGRMGSSGISRKKPLRSTFAQNVDEFIGWDTSGTAKELAAPLSMQDRWLMADRSFDSGMSGMVPGFDACTPAYWDTMGRVGRASSEIRERGGNRARTPPTSRGVAIGDASAPRPPIYARDVPFGMSLLEGDLL